MYGCQRSVCVCVTVELRRGHQEGIRPLGYNWSYTDCSELRVGPGALNRPTVGSFLLSWRYAEAEDT